MNDPASERLLDIMLSEALDECAPPDLSKQILADLNSADAQTLRTITAEHSPSPKKSWISAALAAAILCALLGYGWWIRNSGAQQEAKNNAKPSTELPSPEHDLALDDFPIPPPEPQLPQPSPEPPRGLNLADVPFGNRPEKVDVTTSPNVENSGGYPAKLDTQEIIARLDGFIESAWSTLGISPNPTVNEDVLRKRVELTLGLPNGKLDLSDVEATVASRKASKHLADKWGEHLLGQRAWSGLKADRRNDAIEFLAATFEGKARYDTIVSEMLAAISSDNDGPASIWSDGLSEKSAVPLTDQFCNVMLDLDVSCGRCHSHPLEGRLAQQDYWNLNAILGAGINASKSRRVPTVFYESSDGRQIAAVPALRKDWLGTDTAKPVSSVKEIANHMRNNRVLAAASINGLWKVVFGNRLVGRTSDPLAAPIDKSFVKAKVFLAEQLIAHEFDLGKATAWILSSKPMQLTESLSQLDESSLLASAQQLETAKMQERSFAAFRPSSPDLPLSELVAMVETINQETRGISFAANRTILGQTSDSASQNASRPKVSDLNASLRHTFPHHKSTDLPAGWLASIHQNGGFDQQAAHLFYVAGYSHPNDKQITAAKRIRRSTDTDAIALTQLWWAIKLSQGTL